MILQKNNAIVLLIIEFFIVMFQKFIFLILALTYTFYGMAIGSKDQGRKTASSAAYCHIIPVDQEFQHGLALHGQPLNPKTFTHFRCVNPSAPKGGQIELGRVGSFNTLNPYNTAEEFAPLGNYWDPLVVGYLAVRGPEEPFTVYGFVAQGMKLAPDSSSITFKLNPKAIFHDGSPVTAADVKASYEFLAEHGLPVHKVIRQRVAAIEILDPRTIRFRFAPQGNGLFDKELPLIISMLSIYSKKHLEERLQKGPLNYDPAKPFLSCGPYKVSEVSMGRRVVLQKIPGYWGNNLPIFKGQLNVDQIGYSWFKNEESLFEAFKRGLIHYYQENNFSRWQKSYNFPAIQEKRVLKEEMPFGGTLGIKGFAMNTDSKWFSNINVRKALVIFFDFEPLYKLLGRQACRTESYFPNTEFAAINDPDPEELKLHASLPKPIKWEKLPPLSPKERKTKALALLKTCGWNLKNGCLTNSQGEVFCFRLLVDRTKQEPILAEVLTRQLKTLGIQVLIEQEDSTAYAKKQKDGLYDMLLAYWPHSMSPGVEQKQSWHSCSAGKISRNFCHIRCQNVDALCEKLLLAASRQELIRCLKTLDRALQSGYYVIPLHHTPFINLAYWKHIGHPPLRPNSDYVPSVNAMWVIAQ
ncbi:MAG: hypothetical protein BGO07_00240 [Alphaproteobacteria bacterium 40-19]|nr:MAG: hypothetical protein BGO07_00240 [Alphaproteobacteria bacterium 40-19]